METTAIIPELETALERYDSTLSAIEVADLHLSADQALDVLLARDDLRTIFAETRLESTPQMAKLIKLDNRLKQQASAISRVAPLDDWRNSRQPAEDAWWWFFQSDVEPNPWNRYDWLRNGLAAGALALAASFMVGIYQALSVGGLSWGETFSTIVQGAGLALVGQGALTTTGQQKVKLALAYFKVPSRFYSEATCGVALLLLLITFGLHLYHCTGQKIKIADIVDKYDALAPLTHSRAASGSRAAPLACLVDLRGCFESDQIHSEKHSWLGVYVFLYESVSDH